MTLDEAIQRMMTCAPAIGWCPRENECFLVASSMNDYRKVRDAFLGIDIAFRECSLFDVTDSDDLEVDYYVPDVGLFLTKKPDFDFEYD